mmetsp:Transcript_26372/g.66940  ORF Transcript_26372/g.66940 Transcript_26372/m.66940 type:complete len:150 (+) Transcript_26372:29-478(+)
MVQQEVFTHKLGRHQTSMITILTKNQKNKIMVQSEASRADEARADSEWPPSSRHAPAPSGAYASFRLPLRESAPQLFKTGAQLAVAAFCSPRGFLSCAPAAKGGALCASMRGASAGLVRGGGAAAPKIRPSSAGKSKLLERAKLTGGAD